MESFQTLDRTSQQVGEEWIQALIEKNYQHLSEISQPDVHSRLMTPRRFDTYDNGSDLIHKVENWFSECSSFQKEQSRVSLVGQKLAIFYRLRFQKEGVPYTAEQQIYCTLKFGLIDQLSLLCSGFQPDQVPEEMPTAQKEESTPGHQLPAARSPIQPDATLQFDVHSEQGSVCALLTPAIKHKLVEMSSGQILEVRVNDPTAKGDIEAWCRLSGNRLLTIDQGEGQELHFYLMKK